MLQSRHCLPSLVPVLLAFLSSSLFGEDLRFPLPAPVPAPLPARSSLPQNPMSDLTRSQDYSASRVSSHQPQGGPRDNYYIPITGEEVTLADIKGPGAITHMWTTQRCSGRELILRIYWEGNKHPSVEAPIGDFFGVAMGVNAPMESVPIQVTSEGRSRNCWWNMPFNKSARVTVAAAPSLKENRKQDPNLRNDAEALYFYVDYRSYPKPIPDIHYFHARFTETDPPVRGKPVTLLEAEGDGHFVGVVLGARNRVSGWFGEGDDIFTVDGKVAMIGTGTEDYFCDAWGFRQFSSLYHGAPVMEGRRPGDRLSAYRFHILDPVPFRKTFKLEIEHWPWISPVPNTGRDYYSSLGFWYQKTVHRPWPRLGRIISNGPWDPDKGRWHVPGALEAEDLEVVSYQSNAKGNPRPRIKEAKPNLSGDHMLVFDAGNGGRFSLNVPAEQAGRYAVKIYYPRAPEFGIVGLEVNGKPFGEPVDTYLRRNDLTRPLWPPEMHCFEGVTLKKGRNEFTFSVSDKNRRADGYQIGLDCIVLEREEK
ncbi:MAG: DUF2961 domain-containing protein [Pirellulales bacterium]|nr:DUF2961 domain-containing protein [Pirellulales bacterium]